MLEISAIMNSAVEEIFAFKTCCGARTFDQNLEILITNRGIRAVTVPSYCDIHGSQGTRRITTLMPNGDQQIRPGEVKAFYCMMDEALWKEARELVFYDRDANTYRVRLDGSAQHA